MDEYLIHYGVDGQRWGIRRYQYEDGSYTDIGKLRRREGNHYSDDYYRYQEYTKGNNGPSRKRFVNANVDPNHIRIAADHTKDAVKKAKDISITKDTVNLSNKELQDYINRQNLERQYKKLKYEETHKGRVIAEDILSIVKDAAIVGSIVYGIAKSAKTVYK